MIRRTNAICRIGRQANDIYKYTDDIWADSNLQAWAIRDFSSTISVQGSSQSTDQLCYFSCDIVNHLLNQHHATVYILNNLDTREYFKRLDADEVLRQISCQLLREITAAMPISFLVGILPRFQKASTAKDWFHVLEILMQKLTSLFVVIDASVLQAEAKMANMWVAEFDATFQRLQKTSNVCIKFMILSNRKLNSSSDKSLHVNIESKSNKVIPGKTSEPPRGQEPRIPPLPFYIPTDTRDKYGNETSRSMTDRDDGDADSEESKKRSSVTMEGSSWTDMLTISYRQYNRLAHEENMLCGSLIHDNGNNHSSTSKTVAGRTSSAHSCVSNSVHATRPDSVQISSKEHQRRQEIGVAVICALSWEADAVEVLCDKIYDIHDFGMAAGDLNVYDVVQIGLHRAVILFMPAMGKSRAAASAMNCLHSFPNIRLALLTGICGGIPLTHTNSEIILGDVVISDGLVLYDFGRQFPGYFRRKDTTDDNARKPPATISAFLSKLKTRAGRERLSKRTVAHLDWLRHESPHGDWAIYPGVANDLLFEATYDHKHRNGDCDECVSSTHSVCEAARNAHCTSLRCDMQRTVGRKRHSTIQDNNGRQVSEPAVHFGAYASGDRVMKSGEDRDEIGRREKVIAFEMEGAGIWDNSKQNLVSFSLFRPVYLSLFRPVYFSLFRCFSFVSRQASNYRFPVPTIIIKGVCDYADSHKNKDWQKYAATSAAACMKALLQDWPVLHR